MSCEPDPSSEEGILMPVILRKDSRIAAPSPASTVWYLRRSRYLDSARERSRSVDIPSYDERREVSPLSTSRYKMQ